MTGACAHAHATRALVSYALTLAIKHSWYVRNTHRISELRISSPLRIMSKPEKLRIKVLGCEVDCVLRTAYCVLRTQP
jgi:hypothetical protein